MIFGFVVVRAPAVGLAGPAVLYVDHFLRLLGRSTHRTSAFLLNLKNILPRNNQKQIQLAANH